MTGDQAEIMVVGLAVVAAPCVRWCVSRRRARRAEADQVEDDLFTAFFEKMRVAGEEQEQDPRAHAFVTRYRMAVTGERPRVGAHRGPVVRGRHRLQIA